MPSLPVFVPKAGSLIARQIRGKSAIVGTGAASEDGAVTIYYEGNVNGAENLHAFYSRMQVAAGRCVTEYPTVAMARVLEEDVHQVASYDPVRHVFTEISDPDALEQWAGEPLEEAVGFRLAAGEHEAKGNTDLLNQLHFLSNADGEFIYRTRAGQILTSKAEPTFTIHEHDEPEIVRKLAGILDERRLAYAVGQDTVPSATPTGRLS